MHAGSRRYARRLLIVSVPPAFEAPAMHLRLLGCYFLLLVAVPLLMGCGETMGTVSGKVLFQGELLPSGTIAFQGAKGWVGSSNIQSGEYKIGDVPPGEVKITVQTFPPSPGV